MEPKDALFLLVGDQGDSGICRTPFQLSATYVCIASNKNSLGHVGYLQIWHDNLGGDWFVR